MSSEPRRSRRRGRDAGPSKTRNIDYRHLRSPFPTMDAVSKDEANAIHETALKTLETLGMRVLLPEAIALYRTAGAHVHGEMVYIGRELVEAALQTAPKSILCRGAIPERDVTLELGNIVFQPGAGAPHATDRKKGRRPGTESDFIDLVKLTQSFDVLHMVPPLIEPQDVPIQLRHYATMKAQLTLSDKFPFIFSRGTPQVQESFDMLQAFRGISDEEFSVNPWCYTIINTNSPRTLDIPMAQGLIDFARAGQVSIVTPFTLMGAMAPITVAGAIMLSHAEALAAITLSQLANPGAPVTYGTFTSNVDMKSGAPAFGTPEHFKASLLAGQMARLIGLPWRSATGSAANINDAQAAGETQLGLWGCLLGGATITIHAAGWLEGGLTVSYEKLISDVEILQMIADLCSTTKAGIDEIAYSALQEVGPQGHFFGTQHTMGRYQTEFYQPFLHDWSNFGTWTERGAKDADVRATEAWQGLLKNFSSPVTDAAKVATLIDDIARRIEAGGAFPVS